MSTGSNLFQPEQLIQSFNIRAGDHIADFGAGHGYFAIPLARATGPAGKVYAIDIQWAALDMVRSRAAAEHLLNLEYVQADLDEPGGSRLMDRFVDLVVVANILFQTERKDMLMREAWRILREGGRLAMIEWDTMVESQVMLGPLPTMRVKKETARTLAVQAGFEFDREFSAGVHHYGMIFIKGVKPFVASARSGEETSVSSSLARLAIKK